MTVQLTNCEMQKVPQSVPQRFLREKIPGVCFSLQKIAPVPLLNGTVTDLTFQK